MCVPVLSDDDDDDVGAGAGGVPTRPNRAQILGQRCSNVVGGDSVILYDWPLDLSPLRAVKMASRAILAYHTVSVG